MASVETNYHVWNEKYHWSAQGDEWSERWGSAEQQWYSLILPRIYHYLPADHILEIAPGQGRWTQFLMRYAGVMSLVDLSENCIEYCRKRFAGDDHLRFFVNDGRSLDVIQDQSVDFVFSFDSLVHAEFDVMQGYLSEIQRVLRPGGHAVIHHSNLGEVWSSTKWKIRRRLIRVAQKVGLRISDKAPHWRATSVSAARIREAAHAIGFHCTSQEIFKWIDVRERSDSISVFVNETSSDYPPVVYQNEIFQDDIEVAKQLWKCYGKS
jgi:ubiquinone/menaquinone biosynthesis C-methylase UbiE